MKFKILFAAFSLFATPLFAETTPEQHSTSDTAPIPETSSMITSPASVPEQHSISDTVPTPETSSIITQPDSVPEQHSASTLSKGIEKAWYLAKKTAYTCYCTMLLLILGAIYSSVLPSYPIF